MNTVEDSVLNLATSFFELRLVERRKPKEAKNFDVFEPSGDVELRHEWDALSQIDANLVIAALEEAFNRTVSYINDLHSVRHSRKINSSLKLVEFTKNA